MKPTVLTIAVDLTEARIDTESRSIKDVVLIRAGMSLNRKHYPANVLRESVKHFEGVKAYDSHAPGSRRVAETTGWYANVRFDEGKQALIGDRYFTRTQVGNDVWAIAEDIVAGRAPASLAGLSINAVGVAREARDQQGAYMMVESITKATSIDDVTTPAAGGTYLQASTDEGLAEALIGAMTFEQFIAARPEFTRRLQNEIKNVRATEQERAAQADATKASAALTEAQQQVTTLTETLEATQSQLARARLELAVEKVMSAMPSVPPSWEKSLREAFMSTPVKQWRGMIRQYRQMAHDAGYKPAPVLVEGAYQQVNIAPLRESVKLPPGGLIDWEKIQTPADQARLLESLQVRSN